jgi:hypothetical protein
LNYCLFVASIHLIFVGVGWQTVPFDGNPYFNRFGYGALNGALLNQKRGSDKRDHQSRRTLCVFTSLCLVQTALCEFFQYVAKHAGDTSAWQTGMWNLQDLQVCIASLMMAFAQIAQCSCSPCPMALKVSRLIRT